MSISGVSSSTNWYAQVKAKARQEVPEMVTAAQSTTITSGTSSTNATSSSSASSAIAAAPTSSTESASQQFTDYMQMTPAQRMQYSWLASQGISKQQFDAMSPADKQKLMDEMKQQMQAQAKQQVEAKRQPTDILV